LSLPLGSAETAMPFLLLLPSPDRGAGRRTAWIPRSG
jgi:hypothetical protein